MNEEANFCSQCGATVRPGVKFCSNCGCDLQNSSTQIPLDKAIQVEVTNVTVEKGIKAVRKGAKGVSAIITLVADFIKLFLLALFQILKYFTVLAFCCLVIYGFVGLFNNLGKEGDEPEVKREYLDNGKLRSETHYKDGKKEGLHTVWYKTGEKWYVYHYKNGRPEGLATVWYKNGEKKEEVHFKNGKQEGLGTSWYETGRKKFIKHYKNGKENGLRKEWNEDGTLTSEGNFVDDVEEIK